MGRKKKFIENLSEADKKDLKKGHKYGQQFQYRNRCECILLSNEKHDVSFLSTRFGVSEQTIYIWLRTWRKFGIKGLTNNPGRGRKPKLNKNDETQVAKVKELVKNENQNLNKVVAQIDKSMSVQLCKKTLIRFLKNLNTNGNDSEND